MEKLIQLIKRKIKNYKKRNDKYYFGRVRTITPINLRKGSKVITPQGAGFVKETWGDNKAEIYLETKYRRYTKLFDIRELKQFVVYNPFFNQTIEISAHSYPYIYRDKQPIEYRITTRGKAMLTDYSMEKYEFVKILTKIRYGRSVLDSLEKRGYKIKKNVTKNHRSPRRYQILRRFEIKYLH